MVDVEMRKGRVARTAIETPAGKWQGETRAWGQSFRGYIDVWLEAFLTRTTHFLQQSTCYPAFRSAHISACPNPGPT